MKPALIIFFFLAVRRLLQVLPCSAFESMLRAELSSVSAKAQESLAAAAQKALAQSTANARARFDTALLEAKTAADDASATVTTTTRSDGGDGLLKGNSGAAICAKATSEATKKAAAEFGTTMLSALEGVMTSFEAEVGRLDNKPKLTHTKAL